DLAIHSSRYFHLGQYVLDGNQVSIVLATAAVVVVLGVIFRYTALGLQMRAVVESPRLAELSGIDSGRVGAFAWMLSSMIAGLAGVLLAPLYSSLQTAHFTQLLVA